MHHSSKPLRILAIVNLPWDARLGACRVWMELAEQWRAAGHVVEKFSLSDAFPGVRAERITFALRQIIFVRKAAAFVRQHGHRFDVIDALIGTLPYSRSELGFGGIIVARSVGLYRLYDQFERSVQRRWARPREGKLAGRVLYGFARQRLLRASERSVFSADLLNLPNEEEAKCLREEIRSPRPLIVQAYGLTSERQRAFAEAALPPQARLAQQRVCFIGMWGARKGAYDWARIIARVRQELPQAQFRFLGTMVSAEAIRADLGAAAEGVELISDYQPEELPALLADCTVGAFPSYVEGFGLAVIEQLAAGLPTVAYDTAGPRDILQARLAPLLVPSGATEQFAATLVSTLRRPVEEYASLAKESIAVAAGFSWPKIAHDTITAYQHALKERKTLVFVQPFSLGSPGGGARILRALVEQAPSPWRSVCSSPEKPKPWSNETHLRTRPSWGRIERSRLAALPRFTAGLFNSRFRKRLKQFCLRENAEAIHAVPHAGLEFVHAQEVARELSLPLFLSLHDDLAYTALGRVSPGKREAAMRSAWREAAARFVISDALGQEYCRRYGEREFQVVTDGLTQLAAPRTVEETPTLRIYFMGLFHMAYEGNLRALLEGISHFERDHPGTAVSVVLRCEHVRPQVLAGTKPVTILPFADEAQVQRDIEHADLLYMPIPFGEAHASFARYSLSTKMVTYAGSGVPILYHGPSNAAAFDLLTKHRAAIPITSLVPDEIAAALTGLTPQVRNEVSANALTLARSEFMLSKQAEKFWGAISRVLTAR